MSCGDNASEANINKDEELPEIPPLTYTWSHPDCPFTVDFPSEPEVETVKTELGVVTNHVSYITKEAFFIFVCDAYILKVFPNREKYTILQLAELYADQVISDPDFINPEVKSIKSTNYEKIDGAVLMYSVNPNMPSKLNQINTLVLSNNETMADAKVGYKSDKSLFFAGEDFFQSINLNTND